MVRNLGLIKVTVRVRYTHLQSLAEGGQEGGETRSESTKAETGEKGDNVWGNSGKETNAEATIELGELGGEGIHVDLVKDGRGGAGEGDVELLEDAADSANNLLDNLGIHAGNLNLLGEVKVLDILDAQLLEDTSTTSDESLNHLGGEAGDGGEIGRKLTSLQVLAEGGEGANKAGGGASETETGDESTDGGSEVSKEGRLDTGSLDVGEVGDRGELGDLGDIVEVGKLGDLTEAAELAEADGVSDVGDSVEASWGWGRGTDGRAGADGGDHSIGELHCCGWWVVILKNIK